MNHYKFKQNLYRNHKQLIFIKKLNILFHSAQIPNELATITIHNLRLIYNVSNIDAS